MIKVSEEQAKIIDYYLTGYDDKKDQLGLLIHRVDLDLVTIARIVDGEKYEVERKFQNGDIVYRMDHNCMYIIRNGGSNEFGELPNSSLLSVNSQPHKYKLVAKSENVEKGIK